MSSQDNNRYFEQKQIGESDRAKGLPPAPNAPSSPAAPYNRGYNGN